MHPALGHWLAARLPGLALGLARLPGRACPAAVRAVRTSSVHRAAHAPPPAPCSLVCRAARAPGPAFSRAPRVSARSFAVPRAHA